MFLRHFNKFSKSTKNVIHYICLALLTVSIFYGYSCYYEVMHDGEDTSYSLDFIQGYVYEKCENGHRLRITKYSTTVIGTCS